MKIVIEFIGNIIVGILAFIGVITTLRGNIRAKIISQSRNNWNILMRNSIAEMLAEAETIIKCKNDNDICNDDDTSEKNNYRLSDHYTKFCNARNRVMVRFNDDEAEHQVLLKKISEIDPCSKSLNYEKFKKKRDEIMEITRFIMKGEWERVKEEASGH